MPIKSRCLEEVLNLSKKILKHSKFVGVDESALINIIKDLRPILKKSGFEALAIKSTGDTQKDAQLIFLIDSVNFCFWTMPDKPKWLVEYPKGKVATGGWYSLVIAFERALKEKIPILDVDFLLELKLIEARHIFRGMGKAEIPLLKERVKCLKDSAKILKEKYDGQFINVYRRSKNDAVKLVEIVYKDFKYFRDPFLKRAQILPVDLSYLGGIKMKNLNQLTVFADYRLPQVLRHYGILKYDLRLARKINDYVLIKSGSPEETEIRAATVWACELLKVKLETNASNIDNGLWLLSQKLKSKMLPHHRTYTIYY